MIVEDLMETALQAADRFDLERKAAEIERLRAENRFLFGLINNDALLVERYNAFNERRIHEQSTGQKED